MLYEKNKTEKLSEELFKNPTSEYRGAPFWSWNDKLEKEECVRQTQIFKEMGFGGYHMHPRAGLATPYLGEQFNECVKACVDSAKQSDMLAWLYDEDRYPSGFAGGAVTKDGRLRRRGLIFTAKKRKENATFAPDGRQTSGAKLLATYAVRWILGSCKGYKRLEKGKGGFGLRYYAYLVVDEPTDTFNQAGYVDALYKEALTAFADYTYGTYQKTVGEEFGKTIPAIFTDEPQTKISWPFKFYMFPIEAVIPWTDDFTETYQKTFGADILDTLPELFFDVNTPTLYQTRFNYHTHRTERFAEAFADNLGKRCEDLGIALTGHLMEEPSLYSQNRAVGETMRHYKNFGIPGIDLLCGRHEYTAAKQSESVVRQEGKEGMLCELYGVSRWVAEFGKFKEEGDWLACLGVTVRVPHLSYYSMRGEAKRDYPPSIFYQAPWYKKFKQVEDHFARLNTALTRGRALNDVAVIHPIESYFINYAGQKRSRKVQKQLEKNFFDLTDWLLFNGCDFDFLSEALLPMQRGENPLAVGKCEYKTILVPGLLTMRRSTLDYLKSFRDAGGRVVFLGAAPAMMEGLPSAEIKAFADQCDVIPFEKGAVCAAVAENRIVFVRSESKEEGYLSTIREDNGARWVFVTSPRGGFPYPRSVPVTNDQNVVKDNVRIGVRGEWRVTEYDTMSGEIRPIECTVENGVTYVRKTFYNNDSLLLRYDALDGAQEKTEVAAESKTVSTFSLNEKVPYTLDEPNALLLDKAMWSVGAGFHARTDLDLATAKARKKLGLPPYRSALQPWLRAPETEKKKATLRFVFDSKVALPAHLACEYDEFTLVVNGETVTAASDGYYVDKAFLTYPIAVKEGKNVIDITVPMGKYDRFENCYLLGNFGVDLCCTKARLVPLPEKLAFSDIVEQKLPFYSGKITYHTSFISDGNRAEISLRYASALVTLAVNGEEKDVLFAPYAATFDTKKGENTLEITAYAPRENAFGAVHIRRKFKRSDSPSWFNNTSLICRSRKYVMDRSGVLTSPVIRLLEK